MPLLPACSHTACDACMAFHVLLLHALACMQQFKGTCISRDWWILGRPVSHGTHYELRRSMSVRKHTARTVAALHLAPYTKLARAKLWRAQEPWSPTGAHRRGSQSRSRSGTPARWPKRPRTGGWRARTHQPPRTAHPARPCSGWRGRHPLQSSARRRAPAAHGRGTCIHAYCVDR